MTNHRDFGFDRQGYWDAEPLADLRRHVQAHGIRLDMVALPLPQVSIDRADLPAIMLGTPERDHEIDRVVRCIRAAARAGIPAVKANLTLTGVLRTEPAVGRGGAVHTAFDLSRLELPLPGAGLASAEQAWERIAYFVERVIPAAEEAGVRVAVHPHDPAVPRGMGLDDRVLGDLKGLRRYCALSASPYHGPNFCQGCMEEAGATREELLDAIRDFGRRKKLFLVHFRTVRGQAGRWREAFIDEGDMDMLAAMRAYQAVGYEHMIVPDHYPRIPGDTGWGHQTRAYAIGYLKALVAATGGEAA